MKNLDKKPYLPRVRTSYHPTQDEIRSFAPNGESISLANPAVDPIVCNNIACQEFDYTECLADEGSNILPTEDEDFSD